MLTSSNKLTSALLFEKFNIPTPKTAFVSNEKNIRITRACFQKKGTTPPVFDVCWDNRRGIGAGYDFAVVVHFVDRGHGNCLSPVCPDTGLPR